jgi:hypothetical protein
MRFFSSKRGSERVSRKTGTKESAKENNKGRKGQISLFVIIGIILLIIFALLFSIRKNVEKANSLPDSKKIISELQTGALKDYVTNCIVKTGSEAIEKLGANGGFIYDFEGGKVPFYNLSSRTDYLNYSYGSQTYFVAYALNKNKYCPEVSYAIPDYPRASTPFSSLSSFYNSNAECSFNHAGADYDGFFGQINLTKLCYSAKDSGCERFAKGAVLGLSFQRQIEDYLVTKLPICVNFSIFSQKLKADVVAQSAPGAEVNIHDAEVLFFVKYPVKVTFENSEPISVIVDYQARLPARLGAVYNFVFDILSSDAQRISFNTQTQYASSSFWKQGMKLKHIKTPCSDCDLPERNNGIIEATDENSVIGGHPFSFRFAVQDRRPAIDFIEDKKVDVSEGLFKIPIAAFDPDDYGLHYYFMSEGPGPGWKENSFDYAPVRDSLQNTNNLEISLGNADYGIHPIGVLVVDDVSGFFDYQWFTLTIEDSGATDMPSPDCVPNCTSDGVVSNCDEWCNIAANTCKSAPGDCLGEYYIPPLPSCFGCVQNILDSAKPEPHINCESDASPLDKQSCIDLMPDCFWIREVAQDYDGNNLIKERCVNDYNLGTLQDPAYVIIR